MGGQYSYARCPQSPTEMPKKPSRPKWKILWAIVCGFAVTLVLLFIFLGLYIKLSAECESRLLNHTSSAEGRMTESDVLRAQLAAVNQSLANTTELWASCEEGLKHSRETTSMLEGAVKQKEEALKGLDAVNQSLANTRERWASCKEELKLFGKNTSVLEDNIRKKEETLKRLNGENTRLQNQLADLKKSQETWKQERDKKDKEIQRLTNQLSERQTSSGMVLFGDPIASFLLLIVPGFLCSLL